MVVPSNEEQFVCKSCNFPFKTENWLNTQKTVMTNRGKYVQKRKQTGCPICHKSVSKMVL